MNAFPSALRILSGTVFASWPNFIGASAVLFVAETVYVLFGFGAGLIAVGPLAMLLPNLQHAVVLLFLVNLPAEVLVVRAGIKAKAVDWRRVGLILCGLAVGVPLGTVILRWGNAMFVLTLLAGFLIAAGIAFLLLKPDLRLRFVWPTLPPLGLISGVLAGMFGTGGPPLIFCYRLSGADKTTFRANLLAIFLAISIVRLPVYLGMGLITGERLGAALLLGPAVGLGALLGNRLHLNVKEATFQRLVAAGLVVIGVALVWR